MRTWLLGLLLAAGCSSAPPEPPPPHRLQSNIAVEMINDVRITEVGELGRFNEIYHIRYTVAGENKTVTCTFVGSRWTSAAVAIDCH